MPGYLVQTGTYASSIAISPVGNVGASNVQSAIEELDTSKPESTDVANSISTLENSLEASIAVVDAKATSARTLAMLGL